jgi:hypothetical protein
VNRTFVFETATENVLSQLVKFRWMLVLNCQCFCNSQIRIVTHYNQYQLETVSECARKQNGLPLIGLINLFQWGILNQKRILLYGRQIKKLVITGSTIAVYRRRSDVLSAAKFDICGF